MVLPVLGDSMSNPVLDAAIQGNEILDDPSNVENIPEEEWREELQHEIEEEESE